MQKEQPLPNRDVIVKEQLINAVLQYLSSQPFAEVTGLIQQIQSTAKFAQQEAPPTVKPEEPESK